jgi:cyclin T
VHAISGRVRSPQLSISTALMYMHRFYARKSFQEYDRFIVACTCLLLGGKVEETPKKLKDVLTEAYKVRYQVSAADAPDSDSRKYHELKEQVLVAERILLQTLGFELQLDHPYRDLLAYVRSVAMSRDFAALAWNFVNDSYRTTICLQYDHKTIAAAAVAMVAALRQVTVRAPGGQAGEPPHAARARGGRERSCARAHRSCLAPTRGAPALAQLKNPTNPERPWYEAISERMSDADIYACANTIVDFYQLTIPKQKADEPEPFVKLSQDELKRIRDANSGSAALVATTTPAAVVADGAVFAPADAAVKRPREPGADEPAHKLARSEPTEPAAPTSTPPRAELAPPRDGATPTAI